MDINLTDMERQVLDEITHDEFYEDGLDSIIWADFWSAIPAKQLRGVLSSLVKKGIIYPIEPGRDGCIAFTPYGKDVMSALGYE